MRVRGADDHRIRLARQVHVVRVPAESLDEARVFDTAYRLSDREFFDGDGLTHYGAGVYARSRAPKRARRGPIACPAAGGLGRRGSIRQAGAAEETATMEERVSFVSEGLKLAGSAARARRRTEPARAARRPSWSCTASAATRTAATAPPPRRCSPASATRRCASTCGLRSERGARAAASSASSRSRTRGARSAFLAARPEIDPRAHRRDRRELRRRGRRLHGGRRPAGRRLHLGRRLGRRREEIPQAARIARGLDAIHRHARGGPAPQERGRVDHGPALRHRADPAGACAATSRRARSWSSRSRWSRACTRSGPTTWSARSRPGRSCCCTRRTTP